MHPPKRDVTSRLSAFDLKAGLIVFLVALPLCLGIAAASGAPPMAGLVAGVVGGVLVPLLSRAPLSVSGPAASSTVIVAAAVAQHGFAGVLAATMLAGAMQIVLGVLKLGRATQIVPNAVIRGMLAAIGLILVLKQIPHALGYDRDYEGDFAFGELGGHNTFSEVLYAFESLHAGAILVSVAAVLALALWRDYGTLRLRSAIPRELVALLVGVGCATLLGGTEHALSAEHLVTIPKLGDQDGLRGLWTVPDLTLLTSPELWKTALTLALVTSIQSLLSIEATDRLDPFHRMSPPNRELLAQGVGNLASGALGGLPVTSVIVRSVTNVQAGARTRWASIIHGALLFGATLLLAPLLNRIPLAALAVVLIWVGYQLTRPAIYRQTFAMGKAQFIPFVVTIACIVLTDLLLGVVLGAAFSIFFVLYRDYGTSIVVTDDGIDRMVRFTASASFLHKPALKAAIETAPRGGLVIVDLTRARSIDHDILDVIRELEINADSLGIRIAIERNRSAFHPYFREEEDL